MAYPPVRYHGDGEPSATHRPAGAPPDLTYANGTAVHYLATGAGTQGLFGLYRWEMPAGPGGALPHIHRTMDESFYVLDGVLEVYDGRAWTPVEPGGFVHVPAGGIHGFRNPTEDRVRMLIHFAPGAPREGYFEGLPAQADRDEEGRAAFLRAHDNLMV